MGADQQSDLLQFQTMTQQPELITGNSLQFLSFRNLCVYLFGALVEPCLLNQSGQATTPRSTRSLKRSGNSRKHWDLGSEAKHLVISVLMNASSEKCKNTFHRQLFTNCACVSSQPVPHDEETHRNRERYRLVRGQECTAVDVTLEAGS